MRQEYHLLVALYEAFTHLLTYFKGEKTLRERCSRILIFADKEYKQKFKLTAQLAS